MKKWLISLTVVILLLMTGCLPKNDIKKDSEPNRYVMPKGMKIVSVSREYGGINRVLYRKMRDKETAETYYYTCLEGGSTLTIIEQK